MTCEKDVIHLLYYVHARPKHFSFYNFVVAISTITAQKGLCSVSVCMCVYVLLHFENSIARSACIIEDCLAYECVCVCGVLCKSTTQNPNSRARSYPNRQKRNELNEDRRRTLHRYTFSRHNHHKRIQKQKPLLIRHSHVNVCKPVVDLYFV